MTTVVPQLLYILADDLYRIGNAASPKFHNVRPDDIDRYERNGIEMVSANGRGISLLTEAGLRRREKLISGYVWKLPANLPMPLGLALHADQKSVHKSGDLPDHYLLCPSSDMTLGEYIGLLQKLALKLERMHKL